MLRLLAIAIMAVGLHAATLQRLSLDEMTLGSSDVVRARVVSSRSAFRGPAGRAGMVYTWYTLDVVERLKGSPRQRLEVAVPGGSAGGFTQTIAGAPGLRPGDERVFFIWTSRAGLPQIIGLAQGLFEIRTDKQGQTSVTRQPTAETMLDGASGKVVEDRGAHYTYAELKRLVSATLAGRTAQ